MTASPGIDYGHWPFGLKYQSISSASRQHDIDNHPIVESTPPVAGVDWTCENENCWITTWRWYLVTPNVEWARYGERPYDVGV